MTKYCTDRPMAQGDILIIPINSIPEHAKAAKPVNDEFIVAHSETGHNHVIERKQADVFEDVKNKFVAYVQTHNLGADLFHKRDFHTHETINLAPNRTYEIRRQREHSPDGFRAATD